MENETAKVAGTTEEDKRYISRAEIETLREKARLNAELPKLSNYWKRSWEQLEDALTRIELMLRRVEETNRKN